MCAGDALEQWMREVAEHLLSLISCRWRCFIFPLFTPSGDALDWVEGKIKQRSGQEKKLNKWAATSRTQPPAIGLLRLS
jgi:hypothetical protein